MTRRGGVRGGIEIGAGGLSGIETQRGVWSKCHARRLGAEKDSN